MAYGNPEVTTGGRALKFYSSVRIDIRRIETLKKGTEMIGNRTRAKVVKNKMALPFKWRNLTLCTAKGSRERAICAILRQNSGLSRNPGPGFSYGDERLGQGRDKVKELMKEKPEFADEIEAKIRETFAMKDAP